jgi:hypothetical protein
MPARAHRSSETEWVVSGLAAPLPSCSCQRPPAQVCHGAGMTVDLAVWVRER